MGAVKGRRKRDEEAVFVKATRLLKPEARSE
jgi:hypothetical protein